MAQYTYPLNDTEYTAEQVRLYHAGRVSGIFNVSGEDLTVSWTSGMNVSVTKGVAYLLTDVNGFGGVTYANTESVTLTVDTASSNTRYDYIAVRYVKSKNTCELTYVRGDVTMPKACVRTSNIYEIIVAIIQVPGNAASLSASCIIDTRLNETFCGIVRDGTDKVPTQSMYDRFEKFIAMLDEALDNDTAGTLLKKINTNTNSINSLKTQLSNDESTISSHTNSINTHSTEINTLKSKMTTAEANISNTSNSVANLSSRVTTLENFKYRIGTATPNTTTCPEGYFYFQLES